MKNSFWGFWERGGTGSLAAAMHVDLTTMKPGVLKRDAAEFLESVRDEEAYFCSLCKWNWQLIEHQNDGKPRKRELKNVKVDGDRARGEVSEVLVAKAVPIDGGRNEEIYRDASEYTNTHYFKKTSDGGVLDAPTDEESERDDKAQEKDSEKRKAEREGKEKQEK